MPRVFVSYSHDDSTFEMNVEAIVRHLKTCGLDCYFDGDFPAPKMGWPKWMEREISDADFILVFNSKGYFEKHQDDRPDGKGVKFESMLIVQRLYDDGSQTENIIPILMHPKDSEYIIKPLRPFTYYCASNPDSMNRLLERLACAPPPKKLEVLESDTTTKNAPEPPGRASHLTQSNSGGVNIMMGENSGSFEFHSSKAPKIVQAPISGTIGNDPLLKETISSRFNEIAAERARHHGDGIKKALQILYRNFKKDFGIKDGPWTVIWGWDVSTAPRILSYLDEKYSNTIAGKHKKPRNASALPTRSRLYERESELLSHLGVEKSEEKAFRQGLLKEKFGKQSRRDLTHNQHYQYIQLLERLVDDL